QPKVGNSLEWDLAVGRCPDGWRPNRPDFPEAPDRHWVAELRRSVKADDVFARFGYGDADVEREKFVYYDGIFPQGKWLKFEVTKDCVSITNRVKHPVFDITIVDRRGEGKVRVGRMEKLEPGATVKEVVFANVDSSKFASEAAELLVKQLGAAGLNEDEAR